MNEISDDMKAVESSMVLSVLDFKDDDKDLLMDSKSTHRIKARGNYRLAKIFYDKSDLNKAEAFFLKAWHLSTDSKDIFFQFKIIGFLIRIASEKMESFKAEEYIGRSEELLILLSTQLEKLTAEYFYYEGTVKTYRGKFLEARESFSMAYKKAKENGESEVLAKSIYALSTGYFHAKDFQLSIHYLDQLKEIMQVLKKNYLSGSMHLLYGNIYSEIGEFDNAIFNYIQANRFFQEKSCWNLFPYILMGQGIIFKNKGEFNKSLIYFNMALDSIDKTVYIRLKNLLSGEISDVNDSSVDLYLDRINRMVYEKNMGPIDFKHRFVLLEILFLLAQRPGEYFDKEELAKLVWKDEYNPLIHDKLIYTSVSRLRKLIEPKNERRKYIIRGKDGYTFNQHVNVRFHRETSNEFPPPLANIEMSTPV